MTERSRRLELSQIMVNLTKWVTKRAYQRNIDAPFRQFCSLKHGGVSDLNGFFNNIIIIMD